MDNARSLRSYIAGIGETVNVMLWLWREFVDEEGRVYFRRIIGWMSLAKFAGLVYPWLFGSVIAALYERDGNELLFLFLCIMSSLIVRTAFEWLTSRNIELFSGQNLRTLDHGINLRFFQKELGLHIEESRLLCQSSMEKGRERADPINHMVTFVAVDVLLSLAVTAAVLLVISPLSSAIVMMTIVFSAFVSVWLNNKVMGEADAVDVTYRALIRRRNERWDAVERVKTNGKADEEVEDMDRRFGAMLLDDRNVWFTYINGTNLRNAVNLIGFAAIAWFLGNRVWDGTASVPEFISVLTWSVIVMDQIRMVARLERDISWCTPALKSMRQALELPPRVVDAPDAIELPDEPVELVFDNVSFAYKGKNNVLSDVSLSIERGRSVALIGRSGCGKSTITRLLQRYFDPAAGRILVNGIDLRMVKRASWERLVAYIPQKPQIMDGTLRDNLLYGLKPEERVDWNDEKLWAFVRRFRVDFGVDRLNKGLDTEVGKHGVELSGGEAQRVMIAAAALRGAMFYIIDEATSSLDAEVQDEVQEALYELLKDGAGALIIAHRLSTLMRCDKFVVMQPAVVAARKGETQVEAVADSMQELCRISPTFRQLAKRERILKEIESSAA